MRSVLRAKSDHACVTGVRAGVFAPAVPSGRIGAAVDKDWLAVLDRLLAGDRVAFLEVSRLVTGFLVQLRAYDLDRKSTRLNSSHRCISYAVFCLKKKKIHNNKLQQ